MDVSFLFPVGLRRQGFFVPAARYVQKLCTIRGGQGRKS